MTRPRLLGRCHCHSEPRRRQPWTWQCVLVLCTWTYETKTSFSREWCMCNAANTRGNLCLALPPQRFLRMLFFALTACLFVSAPSRVGCWYRFLTVGTVELHVPCRGDCLSSIRKKRNVTPQCSAAYRSRHSKTKDSHRRESRETSYKKWEQDARKALPRKHTQKTTRQPSAINTGCAKQKNKNGVQKKKISGDRTPQDGNTIQEQNWDRENSPRRQEQKRKRRHETQPPMASKAPQKQKKHTHRIAKGRGGHHLADTGGARGVAVQRIPMATHVPAATVMGAVG